MVCTTLKPLVIAPNTVKLVFRLGLSTRLKKNWSVPEFGSLAEVA